MQDPKPIAEHLEVAATAVCDGFKPIPTYSLLPVVPVVGRIQPNMGRVVRPLAKVLAGLCTGKLRWPLYLWGRTGGGKTMAAKALLRRTRGGYHVVGRVVDQMFRQEDWSWRESIRRRDLIVLDELGEADNEMHLKVIKMTLDDREAYHQRAAIYIGNHHPDKIRDIYDISDEGRIGSRLLCGTIYELDGPDRRKS